MMNKKRAGSLRRLMLSVVVSGTVLLAGNSGCRTVGCYDGFNRAGGLSYERGIYYSDGGYDDYGDNRLGRISRGHHSEWRGGHSSRQGHHH